jgi:Family of unknown function (DUF5994)
MDGAWWPRSDDPAVELVRLFPVLDRWRDLIKTAALSTGGWLTCPTHLKIKNRDIKLTWLRLYRDLLIATCTDHHQIRLLVIPPTVSNQVAADATTIALDPANHASASGIMARATRRPM